MSQKLHLDFIEASPFAPSRFNFIGLVLLGVGLALIFFTLQQYQSKLVKQNEILLKLEQLNHQPQKDAISRNVNQEIPVDIKTQIEAAVDDLTIPWNELLDEIERSDVNDVVLLSLEPSMKKQQVILGGEAKSLHSIMKYIGQLEAQPMLSQVYLQKHSIDEANVSKPLRFILVAQWHRSKDN